MRLSSRITFIAVILTVFISAPELALADGNLLLKQCKAALDASDKIRKLSDEEFMQASFCIGLMQGITNLNMVYQASSSKPIFCLPSSNISNEQATRIVVKWLLEHPQKLHKGDTVCAISAFIDAFPCK